MVSILGVPVDAAYHLVCGVTGILIPILGGPAAVVAIIAVTTAVRILLMPLGFRALRAQAARARLAPGIAALRRRYGGQPEKLQREIAALCRREGTSMFGGVLPVLLQWPFLSVMYLLFRSGQVGGKPNVLLTQHLLGVRLGACWLAGGLAGTRGAVFLGLFALLAAACWLSSRVGRLMAARATAAAPAAATPAAPAAATPAAPAAEDAPAAGPARVLPYLTVAVAAFAPLAAGVYLLTSAAWSLAERWLFLRRSGRASRAGRPAGAGWRTKHSAQQPDRR